MAYKRYPKYKSSEIEWIGEIPDVWGVKPLFSISREHKIINRNNREKNVLSLSYGNIIRRNVESNFGLLPDSFETYNIVDKGNIVLRLTDLQNDHRSLRVGLVKETGIITSAYLTLEVNEKTDSRYFFRVLHTYDTLKVFYGMGGGLRQSLRFDELKRLEIIYPSLPEQQSIASFLDNKTSLIDTYIQKKQKQIEHLKEYRTAVINRAVTKGLKPKAKMKDSGIEWIGDIPQHWEVKKLKYIATVKPSGVDKKTNEDEKSIKLCNYTDVYKNEFINGTIGFMEATASDEEIRNLGIKNGDVLITKDSEEWDDIAVPALVNEELKNVLCGYHLALVRANSTSLNGAFLFRTFQSDEINFQFRGSANGITRYGLSKDAIASALFIVPPLPEQQTIAVYLDTKTKQIDNLIYKVETQISSLQEYRTSLISEATTGKIDVREEVPVVQEKKQKGASQGFKRLVLSAEIISQLHQEPTFGRTKFQKILFLCEYVGEMEEIDSDYERYSAGPYDPKLLYSLDAQLKKQKWYEAIKDEKRYYYKPLEKAGQYRNYYSRYWHKYDVKIQSIIVLLREMTTEQCEIIATLYGAWNDLLIAKKTAPDNEIIHEVLGNWAETKKRISEERWQKGLDWMKTKGLIPHGFGKPIRDKL